MDGNAIVMQHDDVRLIASVIAALGKDGFGARLDAWLAAHTSFDMSCIFSFRFNEGPLLLHDGYSASVSRKALDAYICGGYLLDPFYVASTNGHPGGLWRMRDLAPDCFFSSGFIIDKNIHPCVSSEAGVLAEEIGFIVPLGERHAATCSLMRNQGREAFNEEEMEDLRRLEPVVRAAVAAHVERHAAPPAARARASRADSEDAFIAMFGDRLTPAQRMVAKMILRGHSTLSVARNMNITEGTARIHRSNVYRRLSISSQSELYQLFIDHLGKAARALCDQDEEPDAL